MTEIDNQLLEQFFQPARTTEIKDNGFTERVMKQLPDRTARLSQWWTFFCVVSGVVAFIVLDGWEFILSGIMTLLKTNVGELHPVPFFMTLGVLTCLAVVELVQKLERWQV